MKKYFFLLFFCAFLLVGAKQIQAATTVQDTALTIYRNRYSLNTQSLSLTTPEVVELRVPGSVATDDLYLIDKKTNIQQPLVVKNILEKIDVPFVVSVQGQSEPTVSDNNGNTGIALRKTVNSQELAYSDVEVQFSEPALISGISLAFDSLSQQPQTVLIKALDDSLKDEQVVFVSQLPYKSNFSFPAVKVSKLILTLSYKQTLQLTEVSVNQADASQTQSYSMVRFLAKPASSYFLYTDATTHQKPSVKNQEAGNLFSVQSVRKMMLPAPELNPTFIPADSDVDGILDSVDNCPTVANPDQIDKNYNGVGDVCDDFDYDTIPNNRDNCPD
ncbi:thrombospondin type 3 repeat-containing protein, partial [Candidatus Woesebacteria bacterium]|nr:thrombospondin type 3 repeat-containing protein [Candidatus Woesebacteria bacterium]